METAVSADLTWRLALLGVVIVLDAVALTGLVVKELREQQAESSAQWAQRSGRLARVTCLGRVARRRVAPGLAQAGRAESAADVALMRAVSLRLPQALPDVFERALTAVLPMEVAAALCIWAGIGFAFYFGYLA